MPYPPVGFPSVTRNGNARVAIAVKTLRLALETQGRVGWWVEFQWEGRSCRETAISWVTIELVSI